MRPKKGACQMRLPRGFSSMQGVCERMHMATMRAAARAVALPILILVASAGLARAKGCPRMCFRVLRGPPGRPAVPRRARLQLEHGTLTQHARTILDEIHPCMMLMTHGFVRSYCAPRAISNSMTGSPSALQAAATRPLPEKNSMQICALPVLRSRQRNSRCSKRAGADWLEGAACHVSPDTCWAASGVSGKGGRFGK